MGVHRDTDPDSDEDFAGRWSRRKREAGRTAAGRTVQPAAPAAASSGEDARPPLTDADMPPLESLDERSDYAGFLSPGVSEQLRAKALRKLFRLPGLHVPDGLDDYDDDFTQFAGLGDTITHEMRRMLEREVASAAESEPGDVSRPAAGADAAAAGAVPDDREATAAPDADAADTADDTADDTVDATRPGEGRA